MPAIYKVWLSTDGQYYALPIPENPSVVAYDVLAVQGSGVWLGRRYRPQGWTDTDLRYSYPETAGMIASWSNEGRSTRGRTRYIKAFRLTFCDIRQDIQVLPFHLREDLDPLLAHYEATFHRQRRVTVLLWTQLHLRIVQALAEGYGRLLDVAREREQAWNHIPTAPVS